MTEEITNDIDKLDGMIKIKGKCGYEIIGGCSDLRRLKQEHNELQEKLFTLADTYQEARDACKRLEQENKELRQQYNCYACDTCRGKEDYRNMKRHCENAIKTVHTYRSALEEIKRTLLGVRGLNINCDKQIIKVKTIINEVLK